MESRQLLRGAFHRGWSEGGHLDTRVTVIHAVEGVERRCRRCCLRIEWP